VKPAPFAYHAPTTVEDAVLLLDGAADVRVLAGGQSLVPLMKLRTAKPDVLVDVNGIAGLDVIDLREGVLHVGALVRQQALLEDERVTHGWPLIAEAVRNVGYLATRHRGTVGGSLAYAAPWAELTAAAVALDATIDVVSARGSRSIQARAFFRGPHETALEAGELITAVSFPAPAPRTGAAFQEVSARYRDYAQVGAAALVTLDESDACSAAELVLLRVAPAPFRVDLGEIVLGTSLDEATLDAVAGVLDTLEPPDDVEVSGTFRLRVARTLARRALQQAAARARTELV
jgi:carbon-monoxide dehydrogenase medium subunit